jgi:serine/threonine-protein kinase
MKSMAKNPENRYQTANELREDLERVAQGMPTLATPLLPGESTQVVTRRMPDEGTAVMTGVPPEEEPERRRRWWIVLLVLALLGLLGLAAFFLVRELLPTTPTGVRVPGVVGLDADEATERLEQAGFRVEEEREFNEDVPRNEVIEQDPPAGERVDRGETVTIVVSRGQEPVPVPSVVGLTEEEARAALEEARLRVGSVIPQASEEEEGTVIAQDPEEGDRVRPGFGVTLTVSSGPETVGVPDLICQDFDSAQAEVESAGLDFVPTGTRTTDECPPGTVAEQNPAPGTEVERGSNVRVKEAVAPVPTPTITLPTPTPTDD